MLIKSKTIFLIFLLSIFEDGYSRDKPIHLIKLAGQGDMDAQFHLGNYKKGKGTAQDYKQAINWYQKAADQGHDKAQFHLGNIYKKGKGTAQDYKQVSKSSRPRP